MLLILTQSGCFRELWLVNGQYPLELPALDLQALSWFPGELAHNPEFEELPARNLWAGVTEDRLFVWDNDPAYNLPEKMWKSIWRSEVEKVAKLASLTRLQLTQFGDLKNLSFLHRLPLLQELVTDSYGRLVSALGKPNSLQQLTKVEIKGKSTINKKIASSKALPDWQLERVSEPEEVEAHHIWTRHISTSST